MHKIEQLDEAQATPISHLNNNIKKPDNLAQNNSNYPEKTRTRLPLLNS